MTGFGIGAVIGTRAGTGIASGILTVTRIGIGTGTGAGTGIGIGAGIRTGSRSGIEVVTVTRTGTVPGAAPQCPRPAVSPARGAHGAGPAAMAAAEVSELCIPGVSGALSRAELFRSLRVLASVSGERPILVPGTVLRHFPAACVNKHCSAQKLRFQFPSLPRRDRASWPVHFLLSTSLLHVPGSVCHCQAAQPLLQRVLEMPKMNISALISGL